MMGSWTRQPGEASVYGVLPEPTPGRLNAIATHASTERGRPVDRTDVAAWLRRHASHVLADGSIVVEILADDLDALPPGLRNLFGAPDDELRRRLREDVADDNEVELDRRLTNRQGDL